MSFKKCSLCLNTYFTDEDLKKCKMQQNRHHHHHHQQQQHHRNQQNQTKFATSNTFDEYTRNSTIHGFRYMGNNRRMCEKVFWIIVFTISFASCTVTILSLWIKWENNPVVVTFDEVITDVSKIPFPAITICPSSKVNKSEVDIVENFQSLQLGKQLSSEQLNKMKALYHVCDDDTGLADNFHLFLNPFETDDDGHDVPRILKNITLTTQQVAESEFKYSAGKCLDVFTKTLTEDGVCLTFNIADFNDVFHNHTVHDQYSSGKMHIDNHPYPIYVVGASKNYGLVTGLSSLSKNVEFICNGLDQGYKIILHSPYEFPQTKSKYFQIPYNYKAEVIIKPLIMKMTSGLESLSLNKRQCYLENERKLYFFKKYSKRNCELECLTNATMHHCGCVSFYMPREIKTKICGSSKIQCYHNVTRLILQQYDSAECGCMASCSSINYDAEMHEFVYDIENYLHIYDSLLANISDEILDDPLPEIRGMQYNRISIYFKDAKFVPMKRTVLYGWSDFIANVGGLLGLFMGISILSLVEILYFCCSGIMSSVWMTKVSDAYILPM